MDPLTLSGGPGAWLLFLAILVLFDLATRRTGRGRSWRGTIEPWDGDEVT